MGSGCGKKADKTPATMAFPDSIVDGEKLVTVNDHPVNSEDLRLFAAVFMQQNRQGLPPRVYHEQLLDKLIDRVLIWREAVANNVTMDDSTTNAIIASFIESMGGDLMVNNFLEQMKLQRDELMSSLRKDLLIRKFLEEKFGSEIDIDEAKVKEYFDTNRDQFIMPDSVHARHILVRLMPNEAPAEKQQKREKIEGLLAQIKAGGDFAELAKNNSEDPSAIRGGDLGTFTRGAMVAPFDSAAFTLQKGGVSGVVETQYGFHIIKVEDKKQGIVLNFDEIKEDLKSRMWEFELASLIQNHLQEIKQVAKIERHYQ
jgi:peptidyl-prolyl cis-trans isomerase C